MIATLEDAHRVSHDVQYRDEMPQPNTPEATSRRLLAVARRRLDADRAFRLAREETFAELADMGLTAPEIAKMWAAQVEAIDGLTSAERRDLGVSTSTVYNVLAVAQARRG